MVAIREQLRTFIGRNRRRAGAAVATGAILCAGVLGGCGGGDDDSAPATPTTTSAVQDGSASPQDKHFFEGAEAICSRAIAETKELRRHIAAGSDTNLDPSEVITETVVRPGLRILEQQAQDLRAIAPPEGQNEALDTYLGLYDVIDGLLRRRLNTESLAEAQNLELLITEVGDEQRAAAKTYGFDACATNFLTVLMPPDHPG
jgi:hypothetical protein